MFTLGSVSLLYSPQNYLIPARPAAAAAGGGGGGGGSGLRVDSQGAEGGADKDGQGYGSNGAASGTSQMWKKL